MAGKIKYEEVKESIEAKGWVLISDTYVNLKTDLELNCPNGHEVHTTYEDWRKGNCECAICNQQFINTKNQKPTKPKGNRILAFDQATGTSGWSVFDGQSLVNYGKWSSNGTKSTQKISQTKAWVASMIDSWNPSMVIFEDIQLQKGEFGENVLTFKKLAHLQGVLKNYCYENGIPYKVVPPATWREYSGVKGKQRTDRKKSAQLRVEHFYGIQPGIDAAEAILIGRWAAADSASGDIIMF